MKKNAEDLLNRYASGQCSAEEQLLVEAFFVADLKKNYGDVPAPEVEAAYAHISAGLNDYVFANPKRRTARLWPRIAVAAAAFAAIVFGIWFYSAHNFYTSSSPTEGRDLYAHDVAPGKNTATLTLSNGKTITLSDAKTGVVIGNSKLTYNDGTAIGASNNDELDAARGQVQTITTPRGGTYKITLSDGTKVWLNAASSLTYALALSEKGERRVKLEGEGYFEVAKDKKRPFIVESAGQKVEVLGTHFNVNAYMDEGGVKTTLLEGSVKVTDGIHNKIIRPGEQALNNGKSIQVREADVEGVTDWKNGDFYLDRVDFKVAVRKIARWYDVEIVYDASVPDNIESSGYISRSKKLSSVLRLIEKSGQVHFRVEGKKVYVYH
ncbi:transmembrane sensor [Pedobacter africanus]|uniref:Ferric-dicitrate binding protein FerR (Iron transport regulator) n=1 Tax=Pedobacter africanus TaxID=151894 RepID=A0ACC6KRJ3_9SPHI|nr:FecR domain-containing protein [Pedobacter africanus]MDR6781944.1 ferric-dicitrate binding protein FerR (iron transport regulator) [Pedobacter africanus]